MEIGNRPEAHLKRFFLAYTILAVVLSVALSTLFRRDVRAWSGTLTVLIVVFAFPTIAPSMVQLRTEVVPRAARRLNAIAAMVGYTFVLMPLPAILLAPALGNRYFGTAFVVAGSMPAASGALGFMLLSDADLELGTVLILLGILLTLAATPFWTGIYARQVALTVPPMVVLKPVLSILFTVLGGGQLIRFRLLRTRGPAFLSGPLAAPLSLTTMLGMILLISVALFKEGSAIVARPGLLLLLLCLHSILASAVFAGGTLLSRLLGLSYRENQAVVLAAGTKNMSTAIIVPALAVNPGAARVPAIDAIVYRVMPVVYLQFVPALKRWFAAGRRGEGRPPAAGSL
ncbi:conserved membrane protein of unknown function [Candidatus Hydrogenisulfobacillus filiaventi]|uniref:Bile acid:sodium symporter n=1 Tax=Candidatus Hydrogenisulfobacillus filiaventi TaxID=2707344 RepID=A0A6F8ZJ94_9FIRM|nr:conserved membrane protein of unknown function [Candidatus Hydrogenisulfobacillus filiaventi]